MKALVYKGPGKIDWEEVPNPVILNSTDVIVKMVAHDNLVAPDLHILKGDVPEVAVGRILGHEGIRRFSSRRIVQLASASSRSATK